MSINDFIDGQIAANFANRNVVTSWENYSNRLKSQLYEAQDNADELAEQRLLVQAQLEGQLAFIRALKHELARVCPNSPLLRNDGTERNIKKAAMAEYLNKNGYYYDTSTEMIKKNRI